MPLRQTLLQQTNDRHHRIRGHFYAGFPDANLRCKPSKSEKAMVGGHPALWRCLDGGVRDPNHHASCPNHVEFAPNRQRSCGSATSLRRFLSLGFDPSCLWSARGVRRNMGVGSASFRTGWEPSSSAPKHHLNRESLRCFSTAGPRACWQH
jgi:hypothetical protein